MNEGLKVSESNESSHSKRRSARSIRLIRAPCCCIASIEKAVVPCFPIFFISTISSILKKELATKIMGCCWNRWLEYPTLGLLDPLEYFVTVNHSSLWQRHVAWAKPKGEELRYLYSSQYSSNMILLSLLLGIQINVFFNSAPEMVDLRHQLQKSNPFETETAAGLSIFASLEFWIGFVLLANICVTIMGILATFTTWSMISAISDRNAHCLLRSTMGQYVTSLPPRLVVASVYFFLLWLYWMLPIPP